MRSTKLFQVGVLFLVAAALAISLVGGSMAHAAPPLTTTLTCVADETDPDFGVSGTAKLGKIRSWSGPDWAGWSGELTMSCQSLSPGAKYRVSVIWAYTYLPQTQHLGDFTASGKGAGTFRTNIWTRYSWDPNLLVVSREETVDGVVQLIPVLAGELGWR